MRSRKRTGWRRVINGVNLSVLLVVLFTALPLYWLITSSFKSFTELGAVPPQYFPAPPSLTNYHDAFVNNDFGVYFRNSLIVTLIATALGIGSMWRTGEPCYDPLVREAIGLPETALMLGFIYLGTAADGALQGPRPDRVAGDTVRRLTPGAPPR